VHAILKGKKIPAELKELENQDIFVSANASAWQKHETMVEWVEKIWKPHAAHFKRSLLIFDQLKVHMMPEILKLLEDCQTDVLLVPAGLTFYAQPADVYINGPLKEKLRWNWEEHMTSQKHEGKSKVTY
jgi:hypothetical protein